MWLRLFFFAAIAAACFSSSFSGNCGLDDAGTRSDAKTGSFRRSMRALPSGFLINAGPGYKGSSVGFGCHLSSVYSLWGSESSELRVGGVPG